MKEQCQSCIHQMCAYSGHQIAWITILCIVMANICGSFVWKLLYVTLLVPRILRILLDYWKVCAPLMYILYTPTSLQFLVLE
jgi:hypothetical protein